MDDFAEKIVEPAMEDVLTTDEYLLLYETDLGSELEVLGMALSIEAQALDLYPLAAARSEMSGVRSGVLQQIANDERCHIARLSHHIDNQKDLK